MARHPDERETAMGRQTDILVNFVIGIVVGIRGVVDGSHIGQSLHGNSSSL